MSTYVYVEQEVPSRAHHRFYTSVVGLENF